MNAILHRSPSFVLVHLRFSIIFVSFLFLTNTLLSQTVTDTFNTADISTNLGAYSPSCNGSQATFSITLPAGGPWTVTSVDISYTMTAQNGGFKSHQRSYIRCLNTFNSESSIYEGTGDIEGTQSYSRTGITIANGTYSGNTNLNFEMRAWRTEIGDGCNTTYNMIDNFSWIITIHLGQMADEGSVGIGTTTPATSAILDLTSTTQAFLPPRMTTAQRDAIADPVPGMMLFNTTTQKLEIYISGWSTMSFSSPTVKKLLGGSMAEWPESIQQTGDGGFIVAGYSNSSNTGTLTGIINNGLNDIWILRLDNSGNIIWQKLLGGSGHDKAASISLTSDGGYIVAGYSESSNTGTLSGLTNNGGYDYWILKLDSNGNILWQKLLGGAGDDKATSISPTNDGGYIVCGHSYSSNTGTLTGLTNNGVSDYWILKLDNNGNIIWQNLFGGSMEDFGWDIHEINGEGVVVAGYSRSSNTGTLTGLTNNGLSDYWILKLDNSGNIVWQKLMGGSGHDYGLSVHQTNDGGFAVAGYSQSSNSGTLAGLTNHGAYDEWIIKLDDSGNILWQKLLGGTLYDAAFNIRQTSDGGLIVAGNSFSSNTGTLTGLTNNGDVDNWIVKLDNSGVMIWQKMFGGSQSDQANWIQQTTDGGYIIAGFSSSSNTGSLIGLINNGSNDCWVYKLDANGNPN